VVKKRESKPIPTSINNINGHDTKHPPRQRVNPPNSHQSNIRDRKDTHVVENNVMEEEVEEEEKSKNDFITAKHLYTQNNKNKHLPNDLENSRSSSARSYSSGGNQPYQPVKSLPLSGFNPNLAKKAPTRDTQPPAPNQNKRKFQTPWKDDGKTQKEEKDTKKRKVDDQSKGQPKTILFNLFENGEIPEELQSCDPKLVEMIASEVINKDVRTRWDDIAGLEFAKKAVQEAVIWPMLRPDIFNGIRAPPKGLLLFGPPGTGKTLIGKAIACESKATFFSISASSLMSKWVGEGERLVRTLYSIARYLSPSVIFVDEIDSLLSQRSDSDADNGTRRLKTEFLVQIDGVGTENDKERVLLVGATNRPEELDEAVRRRLVKRLYIPLPTGQARRSIINNLLSSQELSEDDLQRIVALTEGFSGSDMSALVKEAALGPIRDLHDIMNIDAGSVRSINVEDFVQALDQIRPSVSETDIGRFLAWNKQFGSFG
jgi:ATP-dependent 26S proteasome regulatory subunit